MLLLICHLRKVFSSVLCVTNPRQQQFVSAGNESSVVPAAGALIIRIVSEHDILEEKMYISEVSCWNGKEL